MRKEASPDKVATVHVVDAGKPNEVYSIAETAKTQIMTNKDEDGLPCGDAVLQRARHAVCREAKEYSSLAELVPFIISSSSFAFAISVLSKVGFEFRDGQHTTRV